MGAKAVFFLAISFRNLKEHYGGLNASEELPDVSHVDRIIFILLDDARTVAAARTASSRFQGPVAKIRT